jgi:hypothetical protein
MSLRKRCVLGVSCQLHSRSAKATPQPASPPDLEATATEPLTKDPAPPTTTSANATPDSALHLPLAVHQQPTHPTTAAEKTPATATTTAKAPAAIETETASVSAIAIPTTAAATASKPSHVPQKSNHQRRESKKKKAKLSSAKSVLRHQQHARAAAAESRIAGANRRLAEAIASARGRLDGRRIAMGLRDETAVVVRRGLIVMCLAEVVLLLARVAIAGIGVVSETGIVRSGGSRIVMCPESAVAGRGTEVAMM